MNRLIRYQIASLSLAVLAFVMGAGLAGRWEWSLVTIALGGSWWFGQQRGWGWVPLLGLSGFAGTAAVGLLLGLNPWAMLVSLLAALAFWDLCRLAARLGSTIADEGTRSLAQYHLRLLLVTILTGAGLAAIGLTVKLTLNLAVVFALVLFTILSLSRSFRYLRGDHHTGS